MAKRASATASVTPIPPEDASLDLEMRWRRVLDRSEADLLAGRVVESRSVLQALDDRLARMSGDEPAPRD